MATSNNDASSANAQQLGTLQGEVAGLRRELDHLHEALDRIEMALGAVRATLSERQGGMRMLAVLVAMSGALGGALATGWHWFTTKA